MGSNHGEIFSRTFAKAFPTDWRTYPTGSATV